MANAQERGSATVLMIAALALALLVLQLCVLVGAKVVATAKAQAVADLAALSAATTVRWSTPLGVRPGPAELEVGCALARQILDQGSNGMRVELTSCELVLQQNLFSVLITVRSEGNWVTGPSHAVARAGPQY